MPPRPRSRRRSSTRSRRPMRRRIRQRPSRPAFPVEPGDRQIRGGAGDRPPLHQRPLHRRGDLHPQRHRSDQPRRLLLRRLGDRRGRRDRALHHGAPFQHRAVELPAREAGSGDQMGAGRRRRHLPHRGIREAARPAHEDGGDHPHVERARHRRPGEGGLPHRPRARHSGAGRRQPGRRPHGRRRPGHRLRFLCA